MPESSQEPLAIVGIGCRLPGNSNDPESFWDLLIQGKSAIREVPSDRWDIQRYYHEDVAVPIKMITKWGGFVEEVDQFDASFGGIGGSPFMKGSKGNIATEEIVEQLNRLGYKSGIDNNKVAIASKMLEGIIDPAYFHGKLYKLLSK